MNMVAFLPETPHHSRAMPSYDHHRPLNSSPLAPVSSQLSSPSPVSPVAEIQARRKGQYKQRTPSSSTTANKGRYRKTAETPIPFILGPATPEGGQTAFLRERFKADCFERARRAREKSYARRRSSASSDASSDGIDTEMSIEDEDDDSVFNDELFRRVVANEKRKMAHAYALSYELDVGSSFDPDLEDPTEWEKDLCRSPSTQSQGRQSQGRQYQAPAEGEMSPPEDFEDVPPDFDEFDFDESTAWFDECIATLPLDTVEARASSVTHSGNEHQQQMDITMD